VGTLSGVGVPVLLVPSAGVPVVPRPPCLLHRQSGWP
jgi:hypothetical protein